MKRKNARKVLRAAAKSQGVEILVYLMCVFIIFVVDLEIYKLYKDIVSIENEFMQHIASIAAKVAAGEKTLSPEQQAKLLTMAADRNFELKIFKYVTPLLILLTTLTLALLMVGKLRKQARVGRNPDRTHLHVSGQE